MGEEFLAALLSLSLSGACLMGLAEVLARLLRGRIPPGVRRLMWLLVLFRLLCPWSISGGLLDRGTAELRQAAAPEHSTQALEEVPSHTSPSYEITEHEETGRQIDLAAGLTALWAAGFLTALARRGVAYGRMCRELRRTLRPAGPGERAVFARLTQGEKRPPALRVSPAAPTPMLAGLLRPQLILPELELSQEELEGVFSHELTHWRHRDLWIKWLAALAVCVHWFNPAARLLAERLDRDCELYCDQTVARDWDRPRRARYGELLLRLAAGGKGAPSAALFSQKQRLEERLTAMMNGKNYGKKAFVLGAAACLTLALATTALGAYTGPAVEEPLANLTEVSQPETTPTVLSWPVETGDTVELSSKFTNRVIHPLTGKVTSHEGIDLPQAGGTPVLAAADGTVLEAAFDTSDGNYVLLRHGDMTTKYAHLREYTVEPGETVSTGDQIGLVGRTGMATGDHLHFEVALDGTRVDPLDYLDQSVAAVMGGAEPQ